MSIVHIERPEGCEATEIELYLEKILELALWRRPDWREQVTGRMIQTLGLLHFGMTAMDCPPKTLNGGSFKVVLGDRQR